MDAKPLPNWALALRFADGLEGIVQFDPEQFTGALEPLRAPEFFAQVFIDEGAPAWPGNIDLAPDGLYARLRAQARSTAPAR